MGPSSLPAQDSPKQDIKDAGHETKEAAKDTGRATKKAAKKTGRAVKKGTHKAAEKTEEAGRKVKDKVQQMANIDFGRSIAVRYILRGKGKTNAANCPARSVSAFPFRCIAHVAL